MEENKCPYMQDGRCSVDRYHLKCGHTAERYCDTYLKLTKKL